MVDAFSGKNINLDVSPNGDTLVAGYQKRVTLEMAAETKLDLELTEK